MARPKRRVARLIEKRFPSLSPQLREAARFALDHPQDVALESMRSAAAKARVHPNSSEGSWWASFFTALARTPALAEPPSWPERPARTTTKSPVDRSSSA
jgi:hypothetical protein